MKLVKHFSIAPDGRSLLAIEPNEKTVILWDLATGKERTRLEGDLETRSTFCSAFSPDSKTLAIGSQQEKYVRLYDTATGKEMRHFRSLPGCGTLAFSPDGRTLLAHLRSGAMVQWDVASGRLVPASASPCEEFYVLRFVDRDRHLLGVDASHVVLDWRTGRAIRRSAEPRTYLPVWAVLSADEKLLISVTEDRKEGILCDARTGQPARDPIDRISITGLRRPPPSASGWRTARRNGGRTT